MVALQVAQQQIHQMLNQSIFNIQHMNIFLETDILLLMIQLVNKSWEIIQSLVPISIIIQTKKVIEMRKSLKNHHLKKLLTTKYQQLLPEEGIGNIIL